MCRGLTDVSGECLYESRVILNSWLWTRVSLDLCGSFLGQCGVAVVLPEQWRKCGSILMLGVLVYIYPDGVVYVFGVFPDVSTVLGMLYECYVIV